MMLNIFFYISITRPRLDHSVSYHNFVTALNSIQHHEKQTKNHKKHPRHHLRYLLCEIYWEVWQDSAETGPLSIQWGFLCWDVEFTSRLSWSEAGRHTYNQLADTTVENIWRIRFKSSIKKERTNKNEHNKHFPPNLQHVCNNK